MELPVYLFAGFLESGKTRFIIDVLDDPSFTKEERTLLLVCEEGIEEYDPQMLARAKTVAVVMDSQEEMTHGRLQALAREQQADRVLIEWNGMWPLADLQTVLPPDWTIYQIVTTICGPTYLLYAANMGQKMLEQIANADLVVINRTSETDREQIRAKNLRAMNPRATIFFEKEDGSAEDYMEGMEAPFDLSAPLIEVSDLDYGLWYMDAMNDPAKYEGKTVRITGMVYRADEFDAETFVPGRFAMVCCADDVTFVGFLCKSARAQDLKTEDWVTVTARVAVEYYPQYRGDGPVLYATDVVPAQKPDPELVYFN